MRSEHVPQRPDLVVVGGGTAGIVGAKTAASLGADVVLVERHEPGGDCLWTGCVPSKTLLSAAHRYAQSRRDVVEAGTTRGLDISVDFTAVMDRVRQAIATIAPTDSPRALERSGVRVLHGTATFTGPDRIDVDGTPLDFRRALVATGAAPAVPPIPGLDNTRYLTSDTVWSLTELPSALAILGGGSIGCELGQAFARLGSKVTIVEAEDRLLPREDPAAAEIVRHALQADGVEVRLGQPVTRVDADAVTLEDRTSISYAQLLVAVGRTPRTSDLGLDAAGVQTTPRGMVRVDRSLRTTNRRIWAAGDLTGHPQFTHTAGMHGSLAATNAVLGLCRSTDSLVIPRVTFTSPEVAAVGVSPETAQKCGLHTVTVAHREVDRAVAEHDTSGYSTLVLDRRGRILGSVIVGPRAGESIGETTLAIQNGLRVQALASTTHPYPTFSDGIWNAAITDVRRQLRRPGVRTGIRILLSLQRRMHR